MSTTVVELTGDEAALLRSLDKIIQKEREHERQLLGVGDAAGQAGDELEGSARRAKAANDKVLNGLLRDLGRAGPEGREASKALRKHFQDAGKAGHRSMGDVLAQLKKLDPAAAKVAAGLESNFQRSARVGTSAFNAFGTSAVAQITSIAGAYVGVQEAIQLIVQANRKVLETNREIFEGLKQTNKGDRSLLQISENAEDFQQLRDTADRLSVDYGLTREQSRDLVFSARSEGFEGDLDFIASNQQVIDVNAQATAVGQIPGLFKDGEVTGRQSVNAVLAAAAGSRLNFEEIVRELPKLAASTAITGGTAQESAALLSVLSSTFASGATTADRGSALASALNLDERTKGKGLVGGFDVIRALPEEERKSFLGGGKELNEIYAAFEANYDKIAERIDEINVAIDQTGTSASVVSIKRGIANDDPKLAAQLEVAKSENLLEITRENRRATGEGDRQAAVNNSLAGVENLGASPVTIALAETASEALAGFGLNQLSVDIIPTISADGLTNLQRDLGESFDAGDEDAGYALLAASKLRKAREVDPSAIISRGDTAEFLQGIGQDIRPQEVTRDQQILLTKELVEQAQEARGLIRTIAVAVPGRIGENAAAAEGSQSTDRIVEAMERQTKAIEESNELARQQLMTANKTETNTRPRKPDPRQVMLDSAGQN